MEPDRWQRIDELFQAALECEPERRAAFLEESCNGDESLREEVESLLAADRSGDFTHSTAYQDGVRLLESRRELAGRRIGPYRLIREIGYGGMGLVYLAARDDATFDKQVAVKLIPRGLDTEHVVERFRGERQILANLDHPNITRLLDGGTTDDGLPYLVMEYIAGEPIDRYCDARGLNLVERLKLFQAVCAAVQYAHQNLVIHRDIKPANVLVTADGVPRLLDFGIAKLLNPKPAREGDVATMTGAAFLTPVYAAPEQMRGGVITTASDVYSLGVLLYELLTGHRPYGRALSSPAEVERAICEEEPRKPSLAVTKHEEVNGRETTPERLRRTLQGDLDTIVLMALRKEPHRRYASADQFSEDISRHLKNLPVIARPDTRGYRLRKFVRRNRAGVVAATIVVFTLTGGLAATLWQAHVARQQRDLARVEQAKADRIKAFLKDMLAFSSPDYTSPNPKKNQDVKVAEVVDGAARRAEAELADQPEVLEEIQATIGGVYAAQGRLDQAEPILHAARERSLKLYGLYSHQTAEVSAELANVLLEQGHPAEADALFRQDIDIERWLLEHGRGSAANLAYALAGYGGMLDQRNDRAAEGYLKEALKYSYEFKGKERTVVAMLYNDLSNEAGYRGDQDESERYLRASLDEYRRLPPGTYVEMATTLSNLGAVLIRKTKYDEAEPFVREGLELRRRVLGDSHTGTAGALFRLSDLLYWQGKYDEAEKAARESIEVYKRALSAPQDNVLFTNPLVELGSILDKVGRLREAEASLRQALEIRIRLLAKGNLLIGRAEAVLGECLTLQRRHAEAEPLLVDSYTIIESTTKAGDSRRTEAAQRLNILYQSWGKPDKAVRYASSLR
jgi:eukaryotic-like serine/threonine-protein kinase